jgi:hypothetical protein
MKKNYLLIGAIVISFASIAQKTLEPRENKASFDSKTLSRFKKSIDPKAKTMAGTFSLKIDVIGDIMTNKGVDLTSTAPEEDIYITGLNQDSTVKFSSSTSTRFFSDIYLGTVLDPRSIYLQSSGPVVSNVDTYTLDSVFILGSYVKKTAAVDTLYTWIVWGDTTNTSVFTKMSNASVWPAPLSTWRKSIIGPKVSGAVPLAGNKVKAAAPASNMRLIKYVLLPSDSVLLNGRIKYIEISVGAPIVIPAGNAVSVFYTFVPGSVSTPTPGVYEVGYSLSGAPQTINGFAAAIWSQSSPALTALADYRPYQVDISSLSMGVSYDKRQRHAGYSATFNNNVLGDLTSAPVIVYSIYGNSTVGINELEKVGFTLGQNVPNPFTAGSAISYQLANDAKSVMFTVTDVMGRVISFEKAASTIGTHTLNIGSFAAGVYYYSLNVDGKVITKKMIAQ